MCVCCECLVKRVSVGLRGKIYVLCTLKWKIVSVCGVICAVLHVGVRDMWTFVIKTSVCVCVRARAQGWRHVGSPKKKFDF
jgi:hypothetical protein